MGVRHVIVGCVGIVLLAIGVVSAASSDLADAAMKANRDEVRSLIERRVDVNVAQADGATALHWAVQWDDLEMADLLIRAGANVRAENRLGISPMFLAGLNGNAAMIEKLLKAGVDPNAPMPRGETALMIAARTGNVDAVKVLLNHGAKVDAKESIEGTTALMWAAAEQHPAIVQLLIANGADVNAKSKLVLPPPPLPDVIGQEPPPCSEQLRPPQRCTCTEVAKEFCVAAGTAAAAPAAPEPPPLPAAPMNPEDDPNRTGIRTALVFAAREGDVESARILLAAGADVNHITAEGSSTLGVAIQNGNYELAALLLEKGANPNHTDPRGFSPLYLAVHYRNVGRLPAVLMGSTAAWIPDNLDSVELISKLLAAGANPNARVRGRSATGLRLSWFEERGATPFMRAALSGDVTVMRLMLARGADVTVKSRDNTTPLMAAAGIGWGYGMTPSESETLEAMKLLLELGADVNAVNNDGRSALHGAAYKGSNATVQLLVDWGARMDVKDKGNDDALEGLTPLDWAEFGVRLTGASSHVPQPHTAALLRELMTAKGIPIKYASECAVRGFTCGTRDPKLTAP